MNLFGTYTMTWWQVGALKLYVGMVGLLLGAYCADWVLMYWKLLLGVAILLAFYFVYALATGAFKPRV